MRGPFKADFFGWGEVGQFPPSTQVILKAVPQCERHWHSNTDCAFSTPRRVGRKAEAREPGTEGSSAPAG